MSSAQMSIEDQLRAHLSRPGFGTPMDDTPLVDAGFVASLELLELLTFIEDSFGIELEPNDVRPENIVSIAKLTEMIRTKVVDRAHVAA